MFLDACTKVIDRGPVRPVALGKLNRDFGIQVVGGRTPKAGTDVDGIPIFASVADAVDATGATASCIFVPAPGVKAAVLEAAEAGLELIVHHRRRSRPRRGAVLQRLEAGLPEHPTPRPSAPVSSRPERQTSASPPATSPRPAVLSAS
ncbi:MAG: hypothetical protein R2710_02905 [Acidimicrobiales bacterium]